MAKELYQDGQHTCMVFEDLVRGQGIQSNQFLIMHGEHSALLDPGGALTYTPLSMEVGRRIRLRDLTYVLASHQDPDIIASVDRWMMYTGCKVVVSELWGRFVPHLVPGYMEHKTEDRYLLIPDKGMDIHLGDAVIKAIPAHFLHSVGNFQFYDVTSRILFSGDMGASLVAGDPGRPVQDFDAHVPHMLGFHQRYMNSNKVCRLWANMVRGMSVEMLVPQHGAPLVGNEMVNRFLDWVSGLECGTDLLTQRDYRMP